MKLTTLRLLSTLMLILVGAVSASTAPVFVSAMTLLTGYIISFLLTSPGKNLADIESVFLKTFLFITTIVLIRWSGIMSSYADFAVEANDNYKHWLACNDGITSSFAQNFKECIIDNIYIENGGYYFYIRSLALICHKYFDGNSILAQQLGTAACTCVTSIFIYLTLSKYVGQEKTKLYTTFYVLLTPIVLISAGITRDAMITMFYSILIYLWLCKEFSVRVLITQGVIAFVITYLRTQHGLFATSFIFLSLLSASIKNKWVYIFVMMLLVVIYGASMFNHILAELTDTFDTYKKLVGNELATTVSGIGRYVYKLPSPIKEIVQFFVIHVNFPQWKALTIAGNIQEIIIGCLSTAVYTYWFYVSFSTVCYIIKAGFKTIPTALKYAICIYTAFVLMNTAVLDIRRLVAMFPLLFLTYAYLKENCISRKTVNIVKELFIILYTLLVILYLLMTITVA